MSSIKTQHGIPSDNDYDEDDFISFQYESQTINLYYTHLSKYSRLIRKEYLYSDVQDRLPQDLHNLQKQFNIDSANIYHFFDIIVIIFIIIVIIDAVFNSVIFIVINRITIVIIFIDVVFIWIKTTTK